MVMEVKALHCLEKSSRDGEKLWHQYHLRTTSLNAKGYTVYIIFARLISLMLVLWVYFLPAQLLDSNRVATKSYISELFNNTEWTAWKTVFKMVLKVKSVLSTFPCNTNNEWKISYTVKWAIMFVWVKLRATYAACPMRLCTTDSHRN